MESLQRINLYVTFVEKEGPFLKLWGQTDKNNSLYVEQFLAQVAPQFDLGVGKVSPDTLPPGTLICAKYKDNKYYRAKILNSPFVREGSLEVNFIDFGNKGVVSTGSIRSFQNFQPSIVSIPPLALGFIFAEAHCVGGGDWNDTIFESIAKEIKYREVQCTLLSQATNYFLVRIVVEGTDLCNILLQRGLMQPISLQAQQGVLLSMSMLKQGSQSQNQSISSNPQINTYKACTLEPGCQYPVYVSYVNDGPCHFSVQLKQTEDALVMLMNDINSINLRLLEDIPIPGTICLARCIEDSNICRAVVTNEVDTQFKVFYVDFGNYEVLALEALYQIPFKYVLPKVMAIRFALAGVEKSTVTMDMQIAFKKFVDNRLLHMKVLPSPTRTALPKCELWDPDTKTSALDVVIRSAKHSFPEPVALTRGFSQPIKVSFVYSCSRFYVQLVNKESDLASLMAELQEVCMSSDSMNPTSIKVGLPCCALFSADGLWYRSQVVEVTNDNIKVRYIDYGNEESVPVDQLKTIEGEILTVLRPQAIECCLNGYQNMEPDDERDALLEELILEGVFTMKVVDTLNKKTLVDLFDGSDYNVASLLLDKLAAAKSQISPVLAVQAGNKIEHRKSYTKQREQPNFNKGERNYSTGREQKSWDKSNDRNDRNEKSWRQDNRENNRNYDKNSNGTDDTNSWRQNNKGFSPNNRFDKTREQEDSWNTNDNNNANWEDSGTKSNSKPKDSWNNVSTNASQDTWNNKDSNNEWSTPNNNEDGRPQRNDYKSNRGGYNNRGGGGGDRYGGKPRDGAMKKRDYRKDESEASFSGSEKSFHKGPRSSSRIDNLRGGYSFDKPRNNYNRDNRNGSGDSWNANTTTENSWNVSAVTPSIDAAPATATFNVYDVVGTDENVVISWFHNPGLFYVQQVNCQATFKTMMEEICDFYKDKKPDRVVKGAPVIALFDEDNVLYRARVVEVLGTQYKVYYVDFGNVSTVSKAYPIEKKFMDLPAQAIPCSLNGISPPSEEWADPDSYSKYFDKETFLCRFVNKDEEKTYVNLFLDAEDIGHLLVNDGLAMSTGSSVPDIEIPLLLGQQFRAVVKSVNNLSDIILALECGLAIGCTMHNLETAVESFEDTLKGLLEQAVIVYVDNVLEDYRLEITLYDTEGNKHVLLNPDDGAFETVDIPCPMLVLRSVISGYVPHADETSVYIQPNDYADLVISLLDQLFEEYDGKEHDSTIIPEEGMLYAIHSEDGNWYRGKVISFDDEKATVNYVDYGNSEDVSFVELRELTTNFLDINILSLQVSIPSGAESFIDKNITANIYFGEAGWEGTLQLSNSSPTVLVMEAEVIESVESTTEFATNSIEKSENLQELVEKTESTVAIVSESSFVPLEEETSAIPMTGNMVIMSHIDSPSDFYLQFHEAIDEINALQLELQENVPKMEVLENPIHGSLCAAPYAADHQWYRAEVLDADEDITTVRFVDFGNTDVIDNNTTKVKTLPPKLLSLAIYATRCALKIQPIEEEWSSTALAVFEELTLSGTLTAEFFEQDEKCTYVELYTDGINIKDALIKENLAKVATKSTEGRQTGFVSHLNSPSEFWIHLENCVDELEWIAEQLSNAESFPELEDLTPGTLCAALFPDDQMWYRARILSNTVAGIELLFIDYGNCCTSSSLRQLPEDLVITAPLALKCSLQKNEGIPTWSPEAAAKFAELSADGQTIFTVKKISTGETSVVQLLLNGQEVTTMLLPSTEEGLVKEVESLKKLSIARENGENVEVALEPLEGQMLDVEAEEKFKELNEQGSTKFQIEFVDDKTVRLYLGGKDIRPLLGSFKPPKSVEITDFKLPRKIVIDLPNLSDAIAKDVRDSLDTKIDSIINENCENLSDEQVEDACHPEILDKTNDVQEKYETDLETTEHEIKNFSNIQEPLADDNIQDVKIFTEEEASNDCIGLEASRELTGATDSGINEVKIGNELLVSSELPGGTDLVIQEVKISTEKEASNDCSELKSFLELTGATDSFIHEVKIGTELEVSSELPGGTDSVIQEDKICTEEASNDCSELESSLELTGATDSYIHEVKIGTELEASSELPGATDPVIQEVEICTEKEASNDCSELESSLELTGPTVSDIQEVKICTELEASDSHIDEVKICIDLEAASKLTEATNSDTQEVEINPELELSNKLTCTTDSHIQEVKIGSELDASGHSLNVFKSTLECETETIKNLISKSEDKKNLNSSKETVKDTIELKDPTKNIELILLTNIDLLSSGNNIKEACPHSNDDPLQDAISVEETIKSVEQSMEGCTVVQVHLEEKRGVSEEDNTADDIASTSDSINVSTILKNNVDLGDISSSRFNEVENSKISSELKSVSISQEKTDFPIAINQEQVEDQPSTADDDHLRDNDREEDISVDSINVPKELMKHLPIEDQLEEILGVDNTLEEKPLEAGEGSKCIDQTKELPKQNTLSETSPKPKKESSDSAKVTKQKQSSSKLDKSVKPVDQKSVKEVAPKKSSPVKANENKIASTVKGVSLKKASSEISSGKIDVSKTKNVAKIPSLKVGERETKSSPVRTSLCLPKNLSSKEENVTKSPVKQESPTKSSVKQESPKKSAIKQESPTKRPVKQESPTKSVKQESAKSSPKKLLPDSKPLDSKKNIVKNDLSKKLSPVKDVNFDKTEYDNSESIVKGVLKDVIDLACAGDNNQNLQSENSDLVVHEREK